MRALKTDMRLAQAKEHTQSPKTERGKEHILP